MDRLDRIAAQLAEVVAELDASCVEGRTALRRVRGAAEIERLAAVAKALYAKRCVETGVWRTDGDARVAALTPAEWLADVSGSAIGAARDALSVADALPECASTETALRSGQVSMSLAREVTAAAEVGGALAEQRVLATAKREGLRAARDETRRVLAHAADAAEREARIHRQRTRHSWVSSSGARSRSAPRSRRASPRSTMLPGTPRRARRLAGVTLRTRSHSTGSSPACASLGTAGTPRMLRNPGGGPRRATTSSCTSTSSGCSPATAQRARRRRASAVRSLGSARCLSATHARCSATRSSLCSSRTVAT